MGTLPQEALDVTKNGIQILVCPIEVIANGSPMNLLDHQHFIEDLRDWMSLLILPVDLSKFPKYFFRELLLHRCINVERIPPAKRGYEHVICFCWVEAPGPAGCRLLAMAYCENIHT